jgi:hypothetical protein
VQATAAVSGSAEPTPRGERGQVDQCQPGTVGRDSRAYEDLEVAGDGPLGAWRISRDTACTVARRASHTGPPMG